MNIFYVTINMEIKRMNIKENMKKYKKNARTRVEKEVNNREIRK